VVFLGCCTASPSNLQQHALTVLLPAAHLLCPSPLQFIFRDYAWSSWALLHCLPFKTTIGFSNMH
jgi:hypothetical protein